MAKITRQEMKRVANEMAYKALNKGNEEGYTKWIVFKTWSDNMKINEMRNSYQNLLLNS